MLPKRQNIAWQLWIERRPRNHQQLWRHLYAHITPSTRAHFAGFVSWWWMGGKERFFKKIVALAYFVAVMTLYLGWRIAKKRK